MKLAPLLRLYPRKWRERYGDEIVALVDETGLSRLGAFDLVLGAGREWVRLAAAKLTGRDLDRSAGRAMKCPRCKTSIGFDVWLEMKMRSGPVAGRLVRECASCGALLRLTQSWSVTRTLTSGLLLSWIFTDIPGTHPSRLFALAKIITTLILFTGLQIESRAVRLELVPLDYGVPQ